MTLRPHQLAVFYQHMPPYSSAASLRGASVVGGLVQVMRAGTIRVFTTTPLPSTLPGAEVIAIDGAEVENAAGLAARVWGELRMGWRVARSMLQGMQRDDLLLVSTPSYLAALVICARARRRSVPYVLDVRDIYPQAYAQARLIAEGGWLYRLLAARSAAMYHGARRVVTATRGLARAVAAEAPHTSVDCVYNGFPSELRQRHGVKHGRFTLCFHGVLGFFQDVETLIAVARRVLAHDIDVMVIGYGRKEALLRGLLQPNLRFLGRLGFDATMHEIERCHVGLCLRLDDSISRDAFPVKVWECLGLGLPSIVTPPCEAGEFLEQHGCGVQLAAADVDAIVEAVLRLRNGPETFERMQSNCRSASGRFTRERLGLQVAQLIADAARPTAP